MRLRINWIGRYGESDGYGRFNSRMVAALNEIGVDVYPITRDHLHMPDWMLHWHGIDHTLPTIFCMAAWDLPFPDHRWAGRKWLFTMTEGGSVPDKWLHYIRPHGFERIVTPSEHNAELFRNCGLDLPVSVCHGGTNPDEFPLIERDYKPGHPYTFLVLADRGGRKGWDEALIAFYKAFGSPEDTPDVRLLIKAVEGDKVLSKLAVAENLDTRLAVWAEDVPNMRDVYAQADCFVIPSRSEGWGMPHREAAMCGLPVITQRYSGMDDGHTDEWAIVVNQGRVINDRDEDGPVTYRKVDVDELADVMRACHEEPQTAALIGKEAAAWLCQNQTWLHSARRIVDLLEGGNE